MRSMVKLIYKEADMNLDTLIEILESVVGLFDDEED